MVSQLTAPYDSSTCSRVEIYHGSYPKGLPYSILLDILSFAAEDTSKPLPPIDHKHQLLALLFANINQKTAPPLSELMVAMSPNTNTTTNTNALGPQANTSSRRAPDTYTHISRLASPPLWTNLGTASFSQQNYLYLRSRQCGNVTSRLHPRLQYLEYVAEAMDTRTGEQLHPPLCRDCALEVCPDFVGRVEEESRGAREERERGSGVES